jgi:hypothetical protein
MPLRETQKELVERRLREWLGKRSWPKTICPSEVARAFTREELEELGASEWRDTMSGVREVAWGMRDSGDVEILQKGEVIAEGARADDIRGPIRLRNKQL